MPSCALNKGARAFPKDDFPSDNWQLPKCAVSQAATSQSLGKPLWLEQTKGARTAPRTNLGSWCLGNSTVGKLPLGQIPLGNCLISENII